MNKEVTNWVVENKLDPRTVGMIVHHFVDIGCRQAKKCTPEYVEKIRKEKVEEEKELEKENKVMLISPDFLAYLLNSCYLLSNTESKLQNAIIKEYL